jgi:hypothetical protein
MDKGRLDYHGAVLARCLANYAELSCDALKVRAPAVAAECDGVFVPFVDLGGECEIDEECKSGNCYYADEEDDQGTCQPFADLGDDCGGATCGPGTYCAGTCVSTEADGAACRNNFECTTGGCNGYDADTGAEGTCGPMGGEGSQCFLTKGCAAAPPHLFAALAVMVRLWRGRGRSAARPRG